MGKRNKMGPFRGDVFHENTFHKSKFKIERSRIVLGLAPNFIAQLRLCCWISSNQWTIIYLLHSLFEIDPIRQSDLNKILHGFHSDAESLLLHLYGSRLVILIDEGKDDVESLTKHKLSPLLLNANVAILKDNSEWGPLLLSLLYNILPTV